MSDNVNVNPGTNVDAKPIATDEVDGVHYQLVKIVNGGDGEAGSIASSSTPLTFNLAPGSLDLFEQMLGELIAIKQQLILITGEES